MTQTKESSRVILQRMRAAAITIMAVLMAAVFFPLSSYAEDAPAWQDGTWEGTQWGYSSDIKVAVTIDAGKITKVEVVSQDETPIYWDLIADPDVEAGDVDIFAEILNKQSTEVDTVSGATISSTAILGAVDQALAKASGSYTAVTEPQAEWFAGGTGTEADPFQIATAEQLYQVAASMNGDIRYDGYHLKLIDDIDLAGIIWKPIGSYSFPFAGHFDGNGHTISNMVMGTDAKEPYAARTNSRHLGLFGMADKAAVIENVNVSNAAIYARGDDVSVRTGLIVGETKGCIIRNVSADGIIQTESKGGNDVAGGLVGYLRGGALINSTADVEVNSTCSVEGNYDQAGGLVGTDNAGLVANCSAFGDVTASGSGSIVASALVAESFGDVVNCIAYGNITTGSKTSMAGMTSGDIDEGRTYCCWYKETARFSNGGESVSPVPAYGMTYAKVMDYDGIYYIGNMTMDLNAFNINDVDKAAAGLNGNMAKFPVDITKYGLSEDALNTWILQGTKAYPSGAPAQVTYVRPEAEYIPQIEQPMKDGTWYGRDSGKEVIVKVTTKDNAVTDTEVLKGESGSETYAAAYDAAVKKACQKAIYNDTSTYEPADAAVFAGGTGTREDPYQIADEAQLRYIAEAINEDVTWENIWFKQTADITLSDKEWLPIGYSVFGYYRSRWTAYQTYPFLGNYDGGGFAIKGMRIGSAGKPTNDARMTYTAGMFGVVKGTVTQNYTLEQLADQNPIQREISNVTLQDLLINVQNENGLYAGGLIAQPGNGFKIDNCSVSGQITASENSGTLYAGGIIGYGLRGGLVQNTDAAVEINASANRDGSGNVYAGGFIGSDNRVTTVNSFAAGDVTADAAANRIYAGGFSGSCAGANYNVYASGSVKALNETKNAGGLAGSLLYIGAYYHGSANSDADQQVNGTAVEPKVLFGTTNTTEQKNITKMRTAAELSSAEYASELNGSIKTVKEEMKAMQKGIGNDPIHSVYYTGDGSDLLQWTADGGMVRLDRPENGGQGGDTDKIPAADLTVKIAKATYTGKALKPAVTVTYKGEKVSKDQYEVSSGTCKNAGKYPVTITGKDKFTGTTTATFVIDKAAQKMTAKAKTKKLKLKTLKKKAQTVKVTKLVTLKGKQGKVTYKAAGANAKAKKVIKFNAKKGKITVKKGTKKGTYKVRITVKAAGNKNYKAASRTVTAKITVK